MRHWSLWIFITGISRQKPKVKGSVRGVLGNSEAYYETGQLVSSHIIDPVSHEGLGVESLTFRKIMVACKTVTTGLYHEGSTSTGVQEGGPSSTKTLTAIKGRVVASLLQESLESCCKTCIFDELPLGKCEGWGLRSCIHLVEQCM